ncbi:HlyD family efflux transporter periplasmic adaptor subunit [Prochlorococcus marinus]|uniref:HlyD family efflux transporter periplasmic adaptor subunit n=1 Tax=Prochlorococcus marinus TaxID=1219 RepID=UPI0007B3E9DB|nr:biotin/lipoyl-binding protein [Prochlorococcus marinus]KZR74885.1 HlyD family secretion protein [Prochlorococcus marinus str. MIT 1320]
MTDSNDENTQDKVQRFEQEFYPLKIVQPYAWLGIVAVLVGFSGALTWALIGTVRQSVSAVGVVTYPGGLRQVFSPSTERIGSIEVKPGQQIHKGQTIAILEDETQQKKIKAAEKELEKLQRADNDLQKLVDTRIQQAKITEASLQSVYKPLADEAEDLFQQRLITAVSYGSTKKNFLDTRQAYLQQITSLRELRRTLDIQIIEKEANVFQLKSELKEKYYINSPISGQIININYQTGDYPSNDVALATIIKNKRSHNKNNIVVATAKSGDIDKLAEGNHAIFTPDNVERNRFGGIVAKVVKIQRTPITPEFLTNLIGSKQIADKLSDDQKLFYMELQLARDPSTPTGYKWSSGKGPDGRAIIFLNLLGKATVYYEERSPITYVMPFIRKFVGLQDNPSNQ